MPEPMHERASLRTSRRPLGRRLVLLLLLAPLPFATIIPRFADAEPVRVWGTYHGEDPSLSVQALAPLADGVVMTLGHFGDAGSGNPALVRFDAAGGVRWSASYGDGQGVGTVKALASVPALGLLYAVGDTTHDAGIATPGAQQSSRECFDVGLCGLAGFVAQFDDAGELQWGTYFGGPYNEWIASASADPAGSVYICGTTESSTNIATPGGQQEVMRQDPSGFVAKLDRAGSLQWATYHDDPCTAVAADSAGVVIGGSVWPSSGDLVRFDADGVLQWTSQFGEYRTLLHALAIDGSGDVYAVGTTDSADLFVSRRAHQDRYGGGGSDLYVVRFSAGGERQWATYFGGESHEAQPRIALDGAGDLVFGATTFSGDLETSNRPSSSIGDQGDVILGKFLRDGSLDWAVYYGGERSDHLGALTVAPDGRIYLGGHTQSDSGIATPNAAQAAPGNYRVPFLAMFRER